MTIVRMNALNMGAAYAIQLDAGTNADVLLRSAQNAIWVSSLDTAGVRTTINPAWTNGAFAYGGIQQFAGGGFVVYGTLHAGLGRGVIIQTFDASGTALSSQITPMDEQLGNSLSGTGYTVTPTANGGFALTWTSDAFGATPIPVHGNGNFDYTIPESADVRIRYFDAAGNALAPSLVASTAVSSINGAITSRLGEQQYIQDSDTLQDGSVAFVYLDVRQVGQTVGGSHAQYTLTVQVSTGPGSSGTPVKVDLNPFYTGNDGGFSGYNTIDGATGANVVHLANGGFAVIWTENSYVADAGVWGGKRFDGWDSKIRYFDASGQPVSGAIEFLHRGIDMGNTTRYIWADALPDGRIAIAYQDGVGGVNGNGQTDAYLGIIAANGQSTETMRINPTAATNTQFNTIQDLAVRSDGTIDVAYDHSQSFGTSVSLIEHFSTGLGISGAVQGGSDGNDTLNGGAGNDLVTGWLGNDLLYGVGGRDRIDGGDGKDTLHGGGGVDTLAGGEGNDLLHGGTGADVLAGNNGVDTATYYDSAAAVAINLALGTASGGGAAGDVLSGIENLVGSQFDDTLTGDDGDNVLAGLAGNDTLDGGIGNDTADYSAAGTAVTVNLALLAAQNTGGGGTDLLISMENINGSSDADRLTGNSAGNVIVGGGGNDTLTGGTGSDNLAGGNGDDRIVSDDGGTVDAVNGGAGNDTFIIDYNDSVAEAAGGGTDTIRTGWTRFALDANVENLVLTGTASTDGTGNALANMLVGNSAANHLSGLDGSDTLSGGGGADTLDGGNGADMLNGGTGADVFVFSVLAASVDRDSVGGYETGTDTIAISRSAFSAFGGDPAGALGASHFTLGTAATTTDQHLIYDSAGGLLYYDADGSGSSGQVLIAIIANHAVITAADFVLI